MFFNYTENLEKNKQKIIRKDVKYFKKLCLKEVKRNVQRGLDTTTVDFFNNVNHRFEKEIANIVLRELQEEHKDMEISFSFRHFQNSYQGIKIVIK